MRFRIASCSVILLAAACTNDADTTKSGTLYPETSAIDGLASVIQLSSGETSVVLADYFADPAQVDSFHLGGGLSFSRPETGELRISGTPDQAMTVLTAFTGSHQYALPVRASRKITHRFSFDPQGNTYEQVQLVGDLNDWNAARGPMTFQDSVWTMETALDPGKYGYKISVDGRYISDPANPDSASNGMGGFNSIVNLEGPDKTKLPRLRTMRHSESNVLLRVIGQADEVIVLWENHRLSDAQVQFLGDNVSVTLPFAASKRDRSFLRAWAVNQHGVSNDILIPLERGNVVTAPTQLTREDKEASILYFLLVDRFHNGNTGNDAPVEDDRVAPRANYFGGDLAGVREKLDNGFFKELGMNTIWLSPILQNPEGAFQEYPEPRRWFSGYHGYWPISFSNIDHRFGTSEELQGLVDAAHEQDINVILDVVSNHVHEQHPFIQAHPDWSTDLDLPDGTKNLRIWDEQRLTTWFDLFLPSLDFEQPEVVETLSDSAVALLTTYNLDGFRHDATKHISEDYWRALTRKVKHQVVRGQGKRVLQIGETFGSRELIGAYVGSGQMDGQFDFNLYFDAKNVFSEDSSPFEYLSSSLENSLDFYGHHSLMGNITGNHDMPRFLYFAGKSAAPNEDPKEVGWQREIKVEDPIGYEKLKLLTAFIMTVPGVPVVYYGDDIGMAGANDPDNRRPMRFDDLNPTEEAIRDNVKRLAALRNSRLSLTYGETRNLVVNETSWAYQRSYFDELTVVVFNKSAEAQTVEFTVPDGHDLTGLKAENGHPFTRNENQVSVELPAYTFEILTL